MPTVPTNTKCRELGCKLLHTSRSTFCVNHGGGSTVKGKANSKLYSTKYWKQERVSQISKAPLCACCLYNGKVSPAVHTDHVFPHRQDMVKFKTNLFQSLCLACHTLKTQEESKGIYLHWLDGSLSSYKEADYSYIVA